jgi:hypothetical protein
MVRLKSSKVSTFSAGFAAVVVVVSVVVVVVVVSAVVVVVSVADASVVTAGVVEVDETSLPDSEQLVIINRVDITAVKITVFFIFVTPL